MWEQMAWQMGLHEMIWMDLLVAAHIFERYQIIFLQHILQPLQHEILQHVIVAIVMRLLLNVQEEQQWVLISIVGAECECHLRHR
jgi:hypothetical protein